MKNLDEKKTELLGKASLRYHSEGKKGKIEVVSTKPTFTQLDLSLAYTPGVAEPCLRIAKNPADALEYTAKGNLVAVITNGSAVLGLGNIGALAGKPVMEGKAVLFKRFANIDVFDLELDTSDPEKIIQTVKLLEPTFGGINLEDIKAPECFEIETRLRAEMNIPVFHDDQHGTAIISGAALINALEIVGKKIEDVKIVVSGAGAAGIACASFYVKLGANIENILMLDSNGVLRNSRGDSDKNKYKKRFFRDTDRETITDAVKDADVFSGASVKGVLTGEMVKTMANDPIILAMANPDPEISYTEAVNARQDAIVATGRSDFPNQVNNVLGFPFIFRGALDVHAKTITTEMEVAAAYSLSALAKEEVPDSVKKAYGDDNLEYGRKYIIPKPFDPRVLYWAAPAVAQAAMDSGVAQKNIDIDAYREKLFSQVDWSRDMMRSIFSKARNMPQRIVFPEGDHPKVISAAGTMVREGIARPVLLTRNKEAMLAEFEDQNKSTEGIEILEVDKIPEIQKYTKAFYKMRQRKGVSHQQAKKDMKHSFYISAMMVALGDVDSMLSGITVNYPEALKPILRTIGKSHDHGVIAGLYMVKYNNKVFFMGDCSININPDSEELAHIVQVSVEFLRKINIVPSVAMLSFSNFGTVKSKESKKVEDAVKILNRIEPNLAVDGPMQADIALDKKSRTEFFPFVDIKNEVNLLIFPNLDAGNISLKLLQSLAKVHMIGPIAVGMEKPVHIMTRNSSTRNIVNLAAIASVDAAMEIIES